jgi:hypothetical protein
MDSDQSSQSLCQHCGLCCDGTLFGTVPLHPADEVAQLRNAGIAIIASGDDGHAFAQPCVCYEKKLCAIYVHRPQACVDFKCKLLKRYEVNEITRAHAFEVVEKAVGDRDRLRVQLQALTGSSNASVRQLFQMWQDAQGSVDRTAWVYQHAQTLREYGELIHQLTQHFGSKEIEVSAVPGS